MVSPSGRNLIIIIIMIIIIITTQNDFPLRGES